MVLNFEVNDKLWYCAIFREMKKGNLGVVFEILGKKLKDSVVKKVDFGLTGNDGVVHPSLAVQNWLFFDCNQIVIYSKINSLAVKRVHFEVILQHFRHETVRRIKGFTSQPISSGSSASNISSHRIFPSDLGL